MLQRCRVWLIEWLSHLGGAHLYVSTACLHNDHDYCRAPTVSRDGQWATLGPSYSAERDEPKNPARCKFCDAPCRCSHCRRRGAH